MSNNQRTVAIVTGAGRSLGKAIAEALHERGYSIAVTDYDLDVAVDVARQLSPNGSTAKPYRLDVQSKSNIEAIFGQVAHEMGQPEVLVNNAGVFPNMPTLDVTEEFWDRVLNTNLKGSFFCAQTFARGVKQAQRGGVIVNVASTAAFSARIGAAPYSASKAGLVMLTKSLAQEFGPMGIRVNAVAPGLIEVREGLVSQEYRDQFLTLIPSGRTGLSSDISGVVAFLVSDDAEYINGECIAIDGGFLAGRALQRSA